MTRPKIRTIAELERAIGIQRTEPPNTPRSDILRERRKRLGRKWRGR
jgi:hypothetical protein